MNRPWTLVVLVVLLAGCRTPSQGDPFLLGRSTIPPPATGSVGPQGAQSLAPPTVTPAPAQTMPVQTMPAQPMPPASPAMNTLPTSPSSPAMGAPVNTPYNFHQGSYQKSAPEPIAGDWTPSKQTVSTTNRATAQSTPTTITAAKAPTAAVAEATDMQQAEPASDSAEDLGKSTIKVTSFQKATPVERISLNDSGDTAQASSATASNETKSSSAKNLPEPNRFTPSGTVIRIVEPGAKSSGDSASVSQPSDRMTASTFQPQWQKWTTGGAE